MVSGGLEVAQYRFERGLVGTGEWSGLGCVEQGGEVGGGVGGEGGRWVLRMAEGPKSRSGWNDAALKGDGQYRR